MNVHQLCMRITEKKKNRLADSFGGSLAHLGVPGEKLNSIFRGEEEDCTDRKKRKNKYRGGGRARQRNFRKDLTI